MVGCFQLNIFSFKSQLEGNATTDDAGCKAKCQRKSLKKKFLQKEIKTQKKNLLPTTDLQNAQRRLLQNVACLLHLRLSHNHQKYGIFVNHKL